MAWGTYMLRSSFVSVFIRLRVKARENPFRFEMMHRTPGNPTTVNRVRQPAAKMKIPIQLNYRAARGPYKPKALFRYISMTCDMPKTVKQL
jgi:hypothetical protein